MSHDTDKLIRQLSLVAFLMAERRPLTARDVKSNVEGYSEMSDEAFARRFYSDRAELRGARRAAAVAAGRVHGRGALHAPLGAVLPSLARALRRGARGALHRALAARRQLRLRGAAAARAAEPRARPPRLPRDAEPDRRERARARSRLLPGDARPARQARERDLEAADDQVPLPLDLDGQRERADAEPVRAAPRRNRLVRRRPRPRPEGHAHVPRLADPQRHPLRDAAGARLPDPGRLQHRGLPRPRRRGSSATSAARPRSR